MNEKTVGTCSLCGGPVTVPFLWGGIIPPTPTCRQCGATPKKAHGPVIDMEPRKYKAPKAGGLAPSCPCARLKEQYPIDEGITITCGYNCVCKDGKCQISPAGHKIEDQGNVVKVTPSQEWTDRMQSQVLRQWDGTMRDECGIG